ncbi:MAG: hypothetical protein IJT16_12250 [Lachnospiraceae bacterium]|nr:hypothetical protein [Lachnospiraceae bacterium]
MKKKKVMAMMASLVLTMSLCACGSQAAPASDTGSSAGTKAAEDVTENAEITETTENESTDGENLAVILPEDNGGIAGVYKWVEMEKMGVTANLILFDDGTGVFDMLGVVESVKYDDNTMQTSGEGALPQSYTYADGTLTWTAIDKTGEQISTFVKLTAEELAAYEARGIGNAE